MAKKKNVGPKEKVWVVNYIFPHKQDVDTCLARNEANVPAAIRRILTEGVLGDVKDAAVRRQIKEDLVVDPRKALEMWQAWQNEYANFPARIDISEMGVINEIAEETEPGRQIVAG